MLTEAQIKGIEKELTFSTSRSGGKGGQNVNKLETKVELQFNIATSIHLTDAQKKIIGEKYPSFVEETIIKLVSSKHRTQLDNKEDVKNKLFTLLNKLLKPVKKRLATKPTKASKLKKTEEKKRRSETKELRKKIL